MGQLLTLSVCSGEHDDFQTGDNYFPLPLMDYTVSARQKKLPGQSGWDKICPSSARLQGRLENLRAFPACNSGRRARGILKWNRNLCGADVSDGMSSVRVMIQSWGRALANQRHSRTWKMLSGTSWLAVSVFYGVNKHPWKKTINKRGRLTESDYRRVSLETARVLWKCLPCAQNHWCSVKTLQPYREEEPLSSAGLEELLPLFCVPHGEGDGVDVVLEPGCDEARPLIQLEAKEHRRGDCCFHSCSMKPKPTPSASASAPALCWSSTIWGPCSSGRTPLSHTLTSRGNLKSTWRAYIWKKSGRILRKTRTGVARTWKITPTTFSFFKIVTNKSHYWVYRRLETSHLDWKVRWQESEASFLKMTLAW